MIPDELLLERGLGARPKSENPNSHPDVAGLLAPVKNVAPPLTLNLEAHPLAVANQDGTPECVAFGMAAAMEVIDGALFDRTPTPLSPQALYNAIKADDGNTYDGTWTDEAARVLMAQGGFVREEDYPFIPTKDRKDVPPTISRRTPEYRIDAYASGSGRTALIQALAFLGPAAITIPVTYAFDVPEPGGHVTLAQDARFPGYMRGYHCVCAVGYDLLRGWVKVRNSWPEWADGGYGYLALDWLDAHLDSFTTLVRNLSDLIGGDLTGSSLVTPVDAQIALMAAIGLSTLTPTVAKLADVNNYGRVTVGDVIAILRKAV